MGVKSRRRGAASMMSGFPAPADTPAFESPASAFGSSRRLYPQQSELQTAGTLQNCWFSCWNGGFFVGFARLAANLALAMRIISIRQPWASLIVPGGIDVQTGETALK